MGVALDLGGLPGMAILLLVCWWWGGGLKVDFLHLLMREWTFPGEQLDKQHLISHIFPSDSLTPSNSCCFSIYSPENIRKRKIKLHYSICLLKVKPEQQSILPCAGN
ncbi:hypothetical protein MHH28_05275 [Paenibacillus sp. FSL K6-1217]|uniref:hypothetical protein n=1 Tax=Paenibacillus sp. FSL K6-1217 TaxID=2921466 RepID=UPI0032449694